MNVALVCIAKDEDHYLDEWIQYNRKLGFDKIFIYENDWRCPLNYDFLVKIPFDGRTKQMPAYNRFIKDYYKEYDWAAFFDCDEFLVLKKHKTIQEFIQEFHHPIGIGINWQMYGSDNKLKRESDSLLKQFVKRQNGVNEHIKTILNLKSNTAMSLPHNPHKPVIDTNRKQVNGPFNRNGPSDVAVLNHYYHKTLEDWELRCKRGRADASEKARPYVWEKEKNTFNEVIDSTARDFLYL